MRNLLDFLVKYNYWFLFLFLEAVSFVLLFQFNSYQGSVWFSSANAVTGKLYETSSEIESYFQLSKINSELTQRNLYLEQRLHKLEKQIGDSAADSTMEKSLLVKSLQPYRLIPAKVISMTAGRLDNLITINKGEVDGIKKDMGVVCGTGVVGIVYLTSKHYSIYLVMRISVSMIMWLPVVILLSFLQALSLERSYMSIIPPTKCLIVCGSNCLLILANCVTFVLLITRLCLNKSIFFVPHKIQFVRKNQAKLTKNDIRRHDT